jgi:dipeptidyl aminopeptidase/acylaminoacyl peptidase
VNSFVKRGIKIFSAGLLGAVISINLVAFMQARAMTRFTGGGERTAKPEQLSFFDAATVFIGGVNVPRPQNTRTPAALDLPFQTHRFPSGNGSTLEAWYVPGEDERLIVVLFHGYAASKSTILNATRVFHQLGYGTLLVDFYGSGGSSGNETTLGVEEARDVAAAVDYVRQTWPHRQVVLYGISMGGAAILRAVAAEKVNAHGIIIEATFDTLLNTGKSRFRALALPGSPFAELLLFWGSLQRRFNFFSHNPADYARAVNCPTLILHGEKDERATLEQARNLARSFGGSARLIVYPDVPHMAIVDARPSEWTRDIRVFLEHLL